MTIAVIIAVIFVNKPVQSTEIEPTTQIILTSTPTPAPTLAETYLSTSTPTTIEISTQPSEYIEIVVVPDDTCEIIAANFNVSIDSILEKNNLLPSCMLVNGQKILIPFSNSPMHLY